MGAFQRKCAPDASAATGLLKKLGKGHVGIYAAHLRRIPKIIHLQSTEKKWRCEGLLHATARDRPETARFAHPPLGRPALPSNKVVEERTLLRLVKTAPALGVTTSKQRRARDEGRALRSPSIQEAARVILLSFEKIQARPYLLLKDYT